MKNRIKLTQPILNSRFDHLARRAKTMLRETN